MIRLAQRYSPLITFFLSAVVLLTFVASQAFALESPRLFVRKLVDRAVNALEQNRYDDEAMRTEIANILHDSFDLKKIGQLALGPHYRSADPELRAAYHERFARYLIDTYAHRLRNGIAPGDDGPVTFEIFAVNPSRRDWIVQSKAISGQHQVAVDWRVRESKSGPYVVDVSVEGVSLVITHRNEFSAIVSQNGGNVSALISHLDKQVAEQDRQ